VTEPERPGLLGRAAGALTGKVVETIPPDVILDHVDIDALLERIDINRVLDRIDMDRLLSRVDMDTLLRNVDVEALVRRSGVPDIVAESTGRLAGGALDVARRQVVGLDTILIGLIGTVLRRPPDSVEAAPPALRPQEEEQDLQSVSGRYAGPLTRLLGFGIDAALMFALFTLGTAGLDYLLRIFFDSSLGGRADSPWSFVAVATWAFVYVVVTTVIAGRTPGKGIVGLRVVTSAGFTVTPGKVIVRTIMLPVAVAPLGLGLLPCLLGRRRRGLHDAVAGTSVVYDWGDRAAQMPAPVSRFVESRTERAQSTD
jgi:uncharacterized RDD family membrane protein YckC